MPSESSSASNATNAIEPPRDYLSVKKSKKDAETNCTRLSKIKELLYVIMGYERE